MQGDSKFKLTGRVETCLTSDQLLNVPKYEISPTVALCEKGVVTLESEVRGKLPESVNDEAVDPSRSPSFIVVGERSLIPTKALELRPVTLVRIVASSFLYMLK